jgi:uncharacterized protein with HEPN domain
VHQGCAVKCRVSSSLRELPAELSAKHPDLPWTEMIAVRNRVAHGYFAVDVAILHDTARNLLPHLQQALAAVAAEEGES